MTRRTARKRVPLSRDRVLRAALELADEGGIGALTMQQIGRRLGVEAMSLYRHVRNKDDILDGIVDLVFAEVELPTDRSNWRTVLRARSISTRAALRRHPWAITLMESRMAPGPANLRSHEDTLTVLLDSGCSATTATHAYNLVDSYVLGFALQEVNMPFSNAEELAAVGEQLVARCRPTSTRTSCVSRVSCSRPGSTTEMNSSSVSTSSSTASSGPCRERDRRPTQLQPVAPASEPGSPVAGVNSAQTPLFLRPRGPPGAPANRGVTSA